MENEENKIGWQKYESLIEEQLSSTFLSDLFNKIVLADEEEDEESYESAYEQEESAAMSNPAKLALNSKIMEDIGMITNFDCWIGHTNFDITPDIKKNLDSIEGIEVLKIFSRYRFFIGIGKMFDFKSVRNGIEELLLKKERQNAHRSKNRKGDE